MAKIWATSRSRLGAAAIASGFLLACSTNAQPGGDRRNASMNLNEKELSSMLQTVIDAPALQPYYHSEQQGRIPLTVVAQLPGKVDLRKFGQPVLVTSEGEPGKAVLEFTQIQQDAAGCTVEFRYTVEGIRGKFDLSRDADGRWVIRKHELHEN